MHLFGQIQSVSKEANNENHSVPYLGHFLTDLMMIDAAYSGGLYIAMRKLFLDKIALDKINKLSY